ncbi:MAG: YdcF family protein [Pseudomonadota bacterium]
MVDILSGIVKAGILAASSLPEHHGMSIEWLLTNLVAGFLLPPLNGLVFVAFGWLALRRRPRLARLLVGTGFVLLWAQALPVVGNALLRGLEGETLDMTQARQAQAIVVLGGGRYRAAPEYGGDTVSDGTLPRLRYAAKLHRETGLPLLVTGGTPDGAGLSEGEAMRRVLVDELGVPVRWVEDASINTRENARFSVELLQRDGATRILLVTHAWHMPRAQHAFAATGLTVVPAPTLFHERPLTPLDFLPQGYGNTRLALHEWIGILWYRLRS